MGACSSKPKTTEFEGSTEPAKETEAGAADRGIESVDTAQISPPKESAKQEVGAADVKTETLQPTSLPVESKEVEPSVSGLSSTEEGVSHNEKAETDAIEGEARNETAEGGGKVDAGILQKDDEGAGVAGITDVSDKGTARDGGVQGAQDKDFEDKAVVLDEAGAGIGDAPVDKGVAADDEKGPDIGTAAPADEQSKTLQGVSEPPGVESPITGVVQPADPVHADDVPESVVLATLETPAPADSTAREAPLPADFLTREAPVEIDKAGSTGASTGEYGIALTEPANLPPGLPQETSEENKEALHEDPEGGPVEASVSDDGVVQESAADDTGHEEELPASTHAQDVKDTTGSETVEDPQSEVDERTTELQEENPSEEKAKESHVPENEDNVKVVDEPEPEALNTAEDVDVETSTNPKSGTPLEESAVKNDTQPQTLAVEEPGEDDKEPEASPDAGVPEPHGKIEQEEKAEKPHIEEASTGREFVERVDAGKPELPVEHEKNGVGEGDLAFEDASDVPLKVEASHVEPGDTRSS